MLTKPEGTEPGDGAPEDAASSVDAGADQEAKED